MSDSESFREIFQQLRQILVPYAEKGLEVVHDAESDYHLNTHHIMKNGQPLFFGAVNIKKNYVSYHHMPVYVFPELLDEISPELKKRMQGKSCFNFKKPDSELFKELESLTKLGYEKYQEAGYV